MNQIGIDLFAANLVLSGALFCIGAIGLMFKRNAISVFMFVELMLNAVNLTFVAFAVERANAGALRDAAAIILFVITVAAAEAGVGLALFVSVYQRKQNVNVDEMTALSENAAPAEDADESAAPPEPELAGVK